MFLNSKIDQFRSPFQQVSEFNRLEKLHFYSIACSIQDSEADKVVRLKTFTSNREQEINVSSDFSEFFLSFHSTGFAL